MRSIRSNLCFWGTNICKRLFPFLLLLPAGLFFPAQQTQKPAEKAAPREFKIPPEAVKQPNPVKPSPASVAQGKKIYGYDCAMCHGADGDGKGDLAVDMKLKLADYRDPATLKDRTDGELFYIIKNGKGEMTAEGDRAKPDDVWNLVNFIRSLAKKEPGAKPKTDAP
jgi:mono/diheme cytochrome c family protein